MQDQWRLGRGALTAAGVAVADQGVKLAAPTVEHSSWVEPAGNPGYLLGLPGPTTLIVPVSVVVLLAFSARCVLLVHRHQLSSLIAGVMLGGAASNLGDRLVLGEVRDQLVLGPIVGNLADVAIAVGIAGYLRACWRLPRRPVPRRRVWRGGAARSPHPSTGEGRPCRSEG